MTASNTMFTVFSGIGFLLSVIPLRWHLQSWNGHLGLSMYLIWAALICLIYFVDSILWNGNTTNWAPVWCDIATRVQIGFGVAAPACALCIIRRIHNITATATPHGIRREITIELLITVGIPVLEIVMQYIVAGHRFYIFEDYGCAPDAWNTPLAYVLVGSWPLIIAVVTACYGALAIRTIVRKRKELRDLSVDSSSSNYWRLIAWASAASIFAIPMTCLGIFLNVSSTHINPWVSWADTHRESPRVFQYPRILMDPMAAISLELCRWTSIYSAFAFFAFFGTAEAAKKRYRLLASTLAKLLGYTASAEGAATPAPDVYAPLRFAPRTFTAQQVESISGSSRFSDKLTVSTVINECDLELRPYNSTEQPTPSSSSGPHVDAVPRVPEPVLGLPLVGMAVPNIAKAIHRNGALDRV